jgi:universal stress protein E
MDTRGCSQDCALEAEHDEREQYLQRLERIASRVRLHAKKVMVAAEWDFPSAEAIVRRAESTGADLIVTGCHTGSRLASRFRRLADVELIRLSPVPVLLVRRPRPYHHPIILSAVDPSCAFAKPRELDERILCLSTLLGNTLRGELHAVHAYEPRSVGAVTRATVAGVRLGGTGAAQANRRFDDLLKDTEIVLNRRHLIGGSPTVGVVNLARRLRAEIVVAGALSRRGLPRFVIGDTAERLVNALPSDLLVVKPAEFVKRVPIESRGRRVVTLLPPC